MSGTAYSRAERVLAALREIEAESHDAVSAAQIARRAGISGDRRRGNGAVKGSWSGETAPAFAVANTLRGLVRRGLVGSFYDREERRHLYFVANRPRSHA